MNILNDRPNFTTAPTTVEKDTQNPTTYTVEVNDPDGIERFKSTSACSRPLVAKRGPSCTTTA